MAEFDPDEPRFELYYLAMISSKQNFLFALDSRLNAPFGVDGHIVSMFIPVCLINLKKVGQVFCYTVDEACAKKKKEIASRRAGVLLKLFKRLGSYVK